MPQHLTLIRGALGLALWLLALADAAGPAQADTLVDNFVPDEEVAS